MRCIFSSGFGGCWVEQLEESSLCWKHLGDLVTQLESRPQDPEEQNNTDLSKVEEEALQRNVEEQWENNIKASARVEELSPSNGKPEQVSLWSHYGASGDG